MILNDFSSPSPLATEALCSSPLALLSAKFVPSAASNSKLSVVDSAKSFRKRSYKQTPCFARFWPKLSACNSFRMRSYKNRRRKSFRMRSSKKRGEGGECFVRKIPSNLLYFRSPDLRFPASDPPPPFLGSAVG